MSGAMRRLTAGRIALLATCAGALAGPSVAYAQGTVGSRVDAVRDGTVRLSFAARSGVCGNGNHWYRAPAGGGTSYNNWNGSRDVQFECDPGPVRLVVVRANGETTELRTHVGGRWRRDTGVIDIGTVSAPATARWLLTLAERGLEKPARDALHALTITDSVETWPAFLRIAQDVQRPRDVRNQAVFWLGEFAGDKAIASLDSIAYEAGDREVRKQAIFAVSRRPTEEAVPHLLRMAETLPDRELRKTAIFWLSRSSDPRALSWITRTLEGKP